MNIVQVYGVVFQDRLVFCWFFGKLHVRRLVCFARQPLDLKALYFLPNRSNFFVKRGKFFVISLFCWRRSCCCKRIFSHISKNNDILFSLLIFSSLSKFALWLIKKHLRLQYLSALTQPMERGNWFFIKLDLIEKTQHKIFNR